MICVVIPGTGRKRILRGISDKSMDEKDQPIEEQQEEKEKPKPSISPNKDFYFV